MELGGPFPNPVILAPLGTTFRAGLSQNCQLHATEEALSLLKGYLAKANQYEMADSILRLIYDSQRISSGAEP